MESPSELSLRLARLESEVETLKRRVATLETPGTAAGAAPVASAPAAPSVHPSLITPIRVVALVGRALVVLGGAYLLRAVTTEATVLPRLLGVLAGLLYGGWWLRLCLREAEAGHRASAAVHALTATAIAFPLVWESTVRFQVLTPPAAALLLVGLEAGGLLVALRTRMASVAAVMSGFGVAITLALMLGTRDLAPFMLALLGAAGLAEALAWRDRWTGLRWPPAVAVNLAALAMTEVLSRPGGRPEGYPPLPTEVGVLVLLAMPLLYVAGAAARTLVQARRVTFFEMLQVPVALALGLSGAWRALAAAEGSPALVGVLALALGLAAYGLAFRRLEPRGLLDRTYHFWCGVGGAALVVGASLLLYGSWLAAVLLSLGAYGVWLGRGTQRELAWHGLAFLGLGAVASGLMRAAAEGLLAPAAGPWSELSVIGLVALLALLAADTTLARAVDSDGWTRRMLPLAALVLAGWALVGCLARWLIQAFGAGPGPTPDAAVAAAVRTGVLAMVALGLAWAGRRWSRDELLWLAYPLLAIGGFKLLIEDLPRGRPATLFLSLTLYGGALLITPRILRSEADPES